MKPAVRNAVIAVVVLLLVAGAVSAGLVAALSGSDDADGSRAGGSRADGSAAAAPEVTEAPEPGLAELYAQELEWDECQDSPGHECATLQVPLDYADPEGETIGIALLRDPADEPSRRVGSLVVNPGGPGAPGTTGYAALGTWAFGEPLRQRYDIVGFDPRGVQGSAPVDCLSDAQLDQFVSVDPVPDDRAEVEELIGSTEEMAAGCEAQDGEVAAHVSTVEAARDMDVLRAALREPKLAYLGVSYGTKLGATYASLFPDRTGRFVLDGALDPDADSLEVNLTQAEGFEVALRSYVQDCVDQGECFLGDTVDAGVRTVQDLLADIDAEPLPAGERTLTVGNAFYGVILPLYSETSWPMLTDALQSASEGDGSALMQLADLYSSRSEEGYTDNSVEANWAINCLDATADADDPWTEAQVRAQLPEFEKASPTFGATLAWMMTGCTGQQAEAGEPAPEIRAAGADPIMVIGTTRDPATPYRWAEALAGKLESGVLITREGDGHGGYHVGNTCVDDAVHTYLVEGTAPQDDLDC